MTVRVTFWEADGTISTSTYPEWPTKRSVERAAWMRDAVRWSEQEVPDGDDDAPVLAGVPVRVPVLCDVDVRQTR